MEMPDVNVSVHYLVWRVNSELIASWRGNLFTLSRESIAQGCYRFGKAKRDHMFVKSSSRKNGPHLITRCYREDTTTLADLRSQPTGVGPEEANM
jgi:hypothetical protein